MTRYLLMLVAVAAAVAGCTPTYRVQVNTFSQLKEPLGPGTSIYVSADPNSRNPILAERITAKLRSALRAHGYTAAEKAEGAAYMMTFYAGMNPAEVLDYIPIARPYGAFGFYGGGHYQPWGFGYTTFVPYIDTVYAHWLEVRLYGLGPNTPGRTHPIWIGETIVGTDEPDIRTAVNYLIVGLMEYFGTNIETWATVRLKPNDPRVLGLAETQ
jgi:hypothetical protein